MASHASPLVLFLLFSVVSTLDSTDLVFEDGYTVTTLLDGHKLRINPHSVLSRPGSSDLIILDSSGSAFYTVSFSSSQETIERFAGNGTYGFSDGDSGSAMFKKPRSFAVDHKGNVYVADKSNGAIRKISNSGVTTIAGGQSQGHVDGPGQNASFSNDFELAFFPERCALMISDHGFQLVRQINLKLEDCARGSQSVFGPTMFWILALGASCLLGVVIGFVARPYLIAPDGVSLSLSETWKHCRTNLGRQIPTFFFDMHSRINLGRQIPTFCFDIRSAVVSSTHMTLIRRLVMLNLSYLSLLFRISRIESQTSHEKPVSLLDTDVVLSSSSSEITKSQTLHEKPVSLLDTDVVLSSSSSEIPKSQMFEDQLKDLICLDGGPGSSESSDTTIEQGDNLLSDSHQSLDNMIQANIMGFAEKAKKISPELSLMSSSRLVKRR